MTTAATAMTTSSTALTIANAVRCDLPIVAPAPRRAGQREDGDVVAQRVAVEPLDLLDDRREHVGLRALRGQRRGREHVEQAVHAEPLVACAVAAFVEAVREQQ